MCTYTIDFGSASLCASGAAQDLSVSMGVWGELSLAENSKTPTTNLNEDSSSLAQFRLGSEEKGCKHVTIREIVEEDDPSSTEFGQEKEKDCKHITIREEAEEDSND